ncbi:hypothetical protein D3C78_1730060 [compost metagenome]
MPGNKNTLQLLALIVPILLASACTTTLPDMPPPQATAPRIPPLPLDAKQPPAPPWCSPTCSYGLMLERENSRKHMIEPK